MNGKKKGIAIVGLNGAGKSTLSHALGKELGYFVMDSDSNRGTSKKN